MSPRDLSFNDENREAWDTNASFWDERMGEGNDFATVLCWPVILRMLRPQTGQLILDIACGNGLFSRRLAALGVEVTAFDFSGELIRLAKERTPKDLMNIEYKVLDATDREGLLSLGGAAYDAALCNMAMFDIADIQPLFDVLPKLLRPRGAFVFTLTHPAFNNTSTTHVVEEIDDRGEMKTTYSIKVSRYMTPTTSSGLAMRRQAKPQVYFDRPLQDYLGPGFEAGFVVDALEERAFPPDHPQGSPLGWGGAYSEIPPVMAVRMRKME